MTRDNEWQRLCAWVASDLPPPRPTNLDGAIGAMIGTAIGVALWAAIYFAIEVVT
jgi:hypothetical protein